jgi:glycosyltransferase involved in cell wall biosynthesis
MDLSVVLPAYRAAGFLAERLAILSRHLEATGLDYEIVVVDDGSPDATGEVLAALALPRLRVLTLAENRGKFGALQHGMAQARGRCCVMTDADVPYDLSTLDAMASLVNRRGFHLVIGDRTLPDSVYSTAQTWLRRVLTRWFTLLVRLFHTGGLTDTQCGLKAFRGDVARPLFALLRERRFAGDLELLYVALKHNLEVKRVPVRLVYQGPSSVRPLLDGPRLIAALITMRWRYWRGLYESAELRAIARRDCGKAGPA